SPNQPWGCLTDPYGQGALPGGSATTNEMNWIDVYVRRHPIGARVIPFGVFVLLTFLQGQFPSPGQYWLYLAKVIVGGYLLWLARGALAELRWKFSGAALAAG